MDTIMLMVLLVAAYIFGFCLMCYWGLHALRYVIRFLAEPEDKNKE